MFCHLINKYLLYEDHTTYYHINNARYSLGTAERTVNQTGNNPSPQGASIPVTTHTVNIGALGAIRSLL